MKHRGSKRWIQSALKVRRRHGRVEALHKGALHRMLKIPEGVKIPTATLHLAIEDPAWFVKTAKAQTLLRRRAQLALTMRGFRRR